MAKTVVDKNTKQPEIILYEVLILGKKCYDTTVWWVRLWDRERGEEAMKGSQTYIKHEAICCAKRVARALGLPSITIEKPNGSLITENVE